MFKLLKCSYTGLKWPAGRSWRPLWRAPSPPRAEPSRSSAAGRGCWPTGSWSRSDWRCDGWLLPGRSRWTAPLWPHWNYGHLWGKGVRHRWTGEGELTCSEQTQVGQNRWFFHGTIPIKKSMISLLSFPVPHLLVDLNLNPSSVSTFSKRWLKSFQPLRETFSVQAKLTEQPVRISFLLSGLSLFTAPCVAPQPLSTKGVFDFQLLNQNLELHSAPLIKSAESLRGLHSLRSPPFE